MDKTEVPTDSYVCGSCGYVLPKNGVTVSGYDCQASLCHVHCPGCGKIVTYLP